MVSLCIFHAFAAKLIVHVNQQIVRALEEDAFQLDFNQVMKPVSGMLYDSSKGNDRDNAFLTWTLKQWAFNSNDQNMSSEIEQI